MKQKLLSNGNITVTLQKKHKIQEERNVARKSITFITDNCVRAVKIITCVCLMTAEQQLTRCNTNSSSGRRFKSGAPLFATHLLVRTNENSRYDQK